MTDQPVGEDHSVLVAHGEYLTFDDANLGRLACIRNWNHNGPWLFKLHPDGNWVSFRRATHKDCEVLGVPDWAYTTQKVRQG
jgi:hypothetical protein